MRKLLTFLVIAFAVYTVFRFGIIGIQAPGFVPTDFTLLHRACERLASNQPIYQAQDPSPFKYSPTFLLLIYATLFHFPKDIAWAIWCALSISLFSFAAIKLCARVTGKVDYKTYLILGASMVFGWHGYLEHFSYGQCDFILFSLFILAALAIEENESNRAHFLGAVLMSLALVTKPQTGLLLSYFLITRRHKFLFFTALTTLALLFLPAIGWGVDQQLSLFSQWKTSLIQQQTSEFLTGNLNQTLAAALARLTQHREIVQPLTWIFIVIASPLFLYFCRGAGASRKSRTRLLCATLMFYCVVTPLSWRWLTFIWIPVFFTLATDAIRSSKSKMLRYPLAVFILVGILLQTSVAHFFGISEVDNLSRDGLYCFANCLLFGTALLALRLKQPASEQ